MKNLAKIEENRLWALNSYQILDTPPDKFLDNITTLASQICKTPIALISLIDDKRQWFKSTVGIKIKQTAREISFCHHAIQQNDLYIIHDTHKNTLFKENPIVISGPKVRFYAGMPLSDQDGFNLGTLCVADTKPRKLKKEQTFSLNVLSKSIIDYLTLRKSKIALSLATDDLNNLFINSPDLFCIASTEGYFKKTNPAFKKELGYSEKELLSEPFMNFVHPDDREQTISVLQQLGKKGANVKFFRNRYRCKNGNYIWLSWNAMSDKNSGKVIATARNIDEKIRMEMELARHMEEEKNFSEEKILQLTELTSTISHELLNPLNMVLGFSGISVELLDESITMDPRSILIDNLTQIRSDIIKVQEHAKHMSDVVGKMSAINWNSNPYSETINESDKTFRINRVISECAKIAYSNFKEKNPNFTCKFENNLDKKDPKGNLSVHDFSKSIMNLFYNAFEAIECKLSQTPDFTPKIKIKTVLENDKINIHIANNGIQIPPESLKQLFNPFYTTKPPGKGLGLGLSICYNIIKMHHGSISVEKSTEKETAFKILLPARKPN